MAQVQCYFCKQLVDKNGDQYERYQGDLSAPKNFHKVCADLYRARAHLQKYICFLFGLKAVGPRIGSQISTFITKNDYTYEGIENALRYFYEVKNHKDKYSIEDKTIGIVPFVYDEANTYYKKTIAVKKKLEEDLKRKQEKIVVVNIATPKKRERKQKYNPDDY